MSRLDDIEAYLTKNALPTTTNYLLWLTTQLRAAWNDADRLAEDLNDLMERPGSLAAHDRAVKAREQ